jgi:hypothetical protein
MIRCRTQEVFLAGSDGSATGTIRFEFGRPGILRGILMTSPGQPAGMDATLKDETGNTMLTFTNVGNSTVKGNVVTDGVTDDGVATENLSRGALFRSGMTLAITSGDAAIAGPSRTDDGPVICTVWVEV